MSRLTAVTTRSASPARPVARARPAPATRWVRRGWPLPPALALFLFLAGVYILTSGGHTYSYDEETMFGLTQSLVERHSIVVPTCAGCPVIRSQPERAGRNYSRYGPLQSLVAIPPYLLGRALAGGDAAARWFVPRFAATVAVNPLVTAATAALLYALARLLGYRHGPALATALLYGLGTQAWPRAKTFFSDPLTTLLILVAVYCWWRLDTLDREEPPGPGAARWAAGLGLACGLGVATKFGAGIVLPVFALAGAAALWRGWRAGRLSARAVAPAALAGAVAAAVPIALVAYYNWVRFGSPFETGYGGSEVGAVQGGNFWAGFSGLLFSPGKNLFLFSPVVLLALPAWVPFARRHARLALLSGVLIVLHIAFYARVPQWDGGTSWGPRYLDFVVPLLVLPLAAGFDRLAGRGRRARLLLGGAAVPIIALALAVQLLGVLVNFDTGYNRVAAGRRYWTLTNAPPLVHAAILRERVGAWWEARFPSAPGVAPERGFAIVAEDEPLWPRFLPREVALRVRAGGDGPVRGALLYEDARDRRDPPQHFTILVNGQPAADLAETPAPDAGPAAYRLTFTIDPAGGRDRDSLLTIRNDSYAALGPSRTLALTVTSGGRELPMRRRPLIVPFSSPDVDKWSWFFTARNQHLADLWPWYLVLAKLPDSLTRLLVAGTGGGGTILLLLGAASLGARRRG